MNGPSRIESHVFAVDPLSGSSIDSESRTLIKAFSPQLLVTPGVFNVLDFFDLFLPKQFGLDTGVENLSDGVEGQAWPDGRILVSEQTYSEACDGNGRARFTIAHECYHGIKQIRRVLNHSGQAILYRRTSVPPYRDPEWQANRFAASLLMPEKMVKLLADNTTQGQIVKKLVNTFQVSNEAARIRARQILGAKTI